MNATRAIYCTACLICLVFNVKAQQNLALNKPVKVSSQLATYRASNITDGKITRNS